jgi:site-specific DNA recombinase
MNRVQLALYARVSSEQQAEAKTIASQVADLEARIAADGVDLAQLQRFLDEGWSGASLARPALEQVRDQAAGGAVDRLYVHCPDRLARRYAHQALLLEELARAGVEVRFLNRPVGETPEDQLLLQMQGMIAEYERYADIGITLVMPSARLCRVERETLGKNGRCWSLESA